MLAVEPRARHSRDEELRAICIRAGIGHRQCERSVVLQSPMELVLELATPNAFSACAIALRVAALDHEALDHPVEDRVVVIPVLRVHGEVFHRFRALLEEQLHHDVTHRGVDRGLLAQRILCPARSGHGSVFFRRLLVEDVASEIRGSLRGLARAEEEEALLFVCRANGEGIHHLLEVGLVLDDRGASLNLLLHRLALEQRHAKEPLSLLHLAEHSHELVGMDVDDFDAYHGRVNQEVTRIVEDSLLQQQRGRLPHLFLDGHPTAEVKSVQVKVGHVGVALRRREHLERLVVGADHLRRGEAEDSQAAIIARHYEHRPIGAHTKVYGERLVFQELIQMRLALEVELYPARARFARRHLQCVWVPELERARAVGA
mmetsp:Transcript_34881/g.96257  ORF Transcript_34881/g.96257 Transcript_34881/m.96257 type:complete len:374 (+) Transcript_34881:339-1460(+)